MLLQIVPGLKLVEFPSTVTRLLFVVRVDTHTALLPKVPHEDHEDVTVNPHPLDGRIEEPQRLSVTDMSSMKVLSKAVAAQAGGHENFLEESGRSL